MRTNIIAGGIAQSLAVALALAACGADPDEEVTELSSSQEPLTKVTSAAMWPQGVVPICWTPSMTSHPHYTLMTGWIMEALVDNFQPAANLYFEDTGPCPEDAKGVVKVYEVCPSGNDCPAPNAWGIGYSPGESNLYVSLTYPALAQNAAVRQEVILHEFAHVLGFVHEFESGNWTFECMAGNRQAGRTTFGPVDFDSITASTYCHSNAVLSSGDVSALRRSDVYNTPGSQRFMAFGRDTGNDANLNQWTGSSWSWSELSTTNLAGTASVVATRVGDRHNVHAFWRTANSGMYVNWWSGTGWGTQSWTDKSISSNPSAVSYRYYGDGPQGSFAESPIGIDVFAIDSSGNLGSRHWSGSAWSWVNYGKPAGVSMTTAAAVNFRDFGEADERFYVFTRSSAGALYLAYGVGNQLSWTGSLGTPTGGQVAADSTAISYRDANRRYIYLWTTSKGNLWTYYWNGASWTWADGGKPNPNVALSGALTASTWTVGGIRWQSIYVAGTDGNLWERRWNGSSWSWISHDRPPGVVSVTGPSATVIRIPGTPASPLEATPVSIGRHIFVRGSDGQLYVRWTLDSGTNWAWAKQAGTGNPVLYGPPAAVAYWSK